jgi:hypothetical protein
MSEQGFRGIPGVPDELEVIAFREVKYEETYLYAYGQVLRWKHTCTSSAKYVIVRKIEKPKRYRPFANGDEFRPHRDRWWQDKGKSYVYAPSTYGDDHHRGASWESSFVNKLFDDGTPFGVEVIE